MASTIGSKLASMERDCQAMVTLLNSKTEYRPATQLQSLLQQIGSVRVNMEQGESPAVDLEYPAKA